MDHSRRRFIQFVAGAGMGIACPMLARAFGPSIWPDKSGQISIVGFGGIGSLIVQNIVELHPRWASRHFVSLADRPQDVVGTRRLSHDDLRFEFINKPQLVASNVPLFVVAGLGGIAGGELLLDYISHGKSHWDGFKAYGLLILPDDTDGACRALALRQAVRLNIVLDDAVFLDCGIAFGNERGSL